MPTKMILLYMTKLHNKALLKLLAYVQARFQCI